MDFTVIEATVKSFFDFISQIVADFKGFVIQFGVTLG